MATFNLGNTTRAAKIASNFLKQKLQEELTLQGHVGSGALLNSISAAVEDRGQEIAIAIKSLDYGLDLDRKQPPKSLLTSDLVSWLQTKSLNLSTLNILNIAISIQKTIAREGTPTAGAKGYSNAKGSRRTGWLSKTTEENIDRINKVIFEAYSKDIIKNLKE